MKQLFEIIRRSLFKKIPDGFDIESAEYYKSHMPSAPAYSDKFYLLADALSQSRKDGLFLEFGVATGLTINDIAIHRPDRKIYGFDSFSGLPEDWRPGFPKGAFAQDVLPEVESNCELIVGLFDDVLPKFVQEKRQPIAFMHIDCDLYSSTKTVLTHCAAYIGPGTVIVFDEYFNYPGWKQHEYLAWQEFCRDHNIKARHIGFVKKDMQVAFIVE